MPWINATTGLGYNAAASMPVFAPGFILGRDELDALVRYSGPASAIVRRPALDATREGWSFLPDLDEELKKQLRRECERLSLQSLLEKALLFERWYGGAAVIVDALDEQDTKQPWQVGRGIQGFRIAHRHELTRLLINSSGTSCYYYQYTPEAMQIAGSRIRQYHASWVYPLQGSILPDRITDSNNGWGDPILQSIFEALSHSGQGSSAVLEYLQRLSVPFLRLAGWTKLVAGEKGAEKARVILEEFKQRFTAFRLGVVDAGDEINQFSATVSGIAELLEHQRADVACAAQMPQTVIYGRSPAGQNATGKSDLELYYGWIAATIQAPKLRPALDWMLRKILMSPCWQQGEMSNPLIDSLDLASTDLQIEFPALWSASEAEAQATRTARANELATYASMGWLTTDEGRQILRQDGILPDAEEAQVESDLGIASPFLTPTAVRKAAAMGYQLWRGLQASDRISSFVPSINAALRRGEEITPGAAADLDAWFSMHPGPYAQGTPEHVEEQMRGGAEGRIWAAALVSGEEYSPADTMQSEVNTETGVKQDSLLIAGKSYSAGWIGYLGSDLWVWLTTQEPEDVGFWLQCEHLPDAFSTATPHKSFAEITFYALKSLAQLAVGNPAIAEIVDKLTAASIDRVGASIVKAMTTDSISDIPAGRMTWQGLELQIEVPAGGVRIFDDGLRVQYPCAYGYVIGSVGLDGEETDVLIYDVDSANLFAGLLWKDGQQQIDEVKLIIGARDERAASALLTLVWGHRNTGQVIKVGESERWVVLGKEGKDRRDSWLREAQV